MIDVAIRDELVHISGILERLLRAVERRTPGPASPSDVLFGLEAEEAGNARRVPPNGEQSSCHSARHR
ncbi:MAG TPA: hypothetical protein VII47_08305 [Actinomycetota bacterium]|jgi:hypothetical protein